EVRRALELDDDDRLVADRPAIVARRDAVDRAWRQFDFRPIVVADAEPPRDHVADVIGLAAVRLHDWLDAFGPAPAWLERVLANLAAGQPDEFDLRPLRGPSLIWL